MNGVKNSISITFKFINLLIFTKQVFFITRSKKYG